MLFQMFFLEHCVSPSLVGLRHVKFSGGLLQVVKPIRPLDCKKPFVQVPVGWNFEDRFEGTSSTSTLGKQ